MYFKVKLLIQCWGKLLNALRYYINPQKSNYILSYILWNAMRYVSVTFYHLGWAYALPTKMYLTLLQSVLTFTFMHLADAFIQSDLQVIHFLSVCVFPEN